MPRRNEQRQAAQPAPIQIAEPTILNAVYQFILAQPELILASDHRDNLRNRGLSDDVITRAGYASLPVKLSPAVTLRVRNKFPDSWKAIPGIHHSKLAIGFRSGLLIPVRDTSGQTLRLQLRLDETHSASKYVYLSCPEKTSPESPRASKMCHVPLGVSGNCASVVAVEGILKADVAYHFLQQPTIGFPDAHSWKLIAPTARQLGASNVDLAFDADWMTNVNVCRPLLNCMQWLKSEGLSVTLLTWPTEHKGLDDLLAAGRGSEITRHEYAAAIELIKQWLSKLQPSELSASAIETAGAGDGLEESVDDPDRLARTFRELQGSSRIVSWRGDFYSYDGCTYRQRNEDDIRISLESHIKSEFDRDAIEEYQRKLKRDPKKARPVKPLQLTAARRNNAFMALKRQSHLISEQEPPTWLDSERQLPCDDVIVCRNAVVHLPSLIRDEPCRIENTSSLFVIGGVDYEFNPEADCPHWLKFLEQVWCDEESRFALQLWFGYALMQSKPYHKILWLVGPGRSGKGTICRVLENLIGKDRCDSRTLGSLIEPFGLAPLLNKRLVTFPESKLGRSNDAELVVEKLLSISADDPQYVNRKGLPQLTSVRLPCKLMCTSNTSPSLPDPSGALAGRFLMLTLSRSFADCVDPLLFENKLRPELPGILIWAVQGYAALIERGELLQPQSGSRRLKDWVTASNPIRAFLDEICELSPELSIPKQNLWAAYRAWCNQSGNRPGSEGAFASELRAAAPRVTDSRDSTGSRVRRWIGVGLRQEL